jgi:hypothetical protein
VRALLQAFVYPYDLGVLTNARQVFGDMLALWWLPGPVKGMRQGGVLIGWWKIARL